MRKSVCIFCLLACLIGTACAQVQIGLTDDQSQISVSQTTAPGLVHHLELSPDLQQWEETAFSNAAFAGYTLPLEGSAFLRIRSRPADDASDWSNQLSVVDQRLFTQQAPAFAKFTVKLAEPNRVYFQDSDRYPFHFHFARARLEGYQDVSIQDYTRVSLFREGQELLVGTVILTPDPSITEVAIQITGNEPFPKEDIALWYQTVRSRIVAPEGWRYLYMPTFEQSAVAFEHEDWFAQQGIVVDTAARWITQNACYSKGWALGKVIYIEATDIDAAYGDGRLTHRDILVTNQIPAEIPVVAGVLALAPATPNSHVAILSKSFGIPFAYPSGVALQEQVRSMVGREVLLVVSTVNDSCAISLQDVAGKLTPEERQAILDSKRPKTATIQPIASTGSIAIETSTLTPNDIDRVGGKAANFGVLRSAISTHAPDPAIALTFDLWTEYMAQPYQGTTLGSSIATDLEAFDFPPNVSALRPVLEEIRDRIRNQADFTELQKAKILNALTDFDDLRRLRFRSSTNVEDSEVFSGAGLYDSYSGCLADDLDGDDVGPSHCDANQESERGVFRAIRKVYASFYNENAFIERLRHGIEESQVGMAVLVHHSFPDEQELANGVATLAIRKSDDAERLVAAQLVSQTGANSITNPNNEFLPEIVSAVYQGPSGDAGITVNQRSALGGEADNVLIWEDDYRTLIHLLDSAARAYEAYFPADLILDLDFEWKKMAPGNLVIKQIRRIPHPPVVPPPVIE